MKVKCKILGLVKNDRNYSLTLEDLTERKIKLPIIFEKFSGEIINKFLNGKEDVLRDSAIGHLIEKGGINVEEVFINEIKDGLFSSIVKLSNGEQFESKLVDSFFIYLLSNCILSVDKSIMIEYGVALDSENNLIEGEITYDDDELESDIESLEDKLNKAIEEQRFEDASKLRDEINKLKN